SYHNDKIFAIAVTGGTPRLLSPADATYQVLDAQWAGDGKSLYFLANLGVHTELMKLDVETRDVTWLTFGEHTIGGWRYSPGAGRHVFTRNTTTRASEVYTLPADGDSEPLRVTDVFAYLEREFQLARQHDITWKGQD